MQFNVSFLKTLKDSVIIKLVSLAISSYTFFFFLIIAILCEMY